jgi:adenylylsulfate kinase-like enzyme
MRVRQSATRAGGRADSLPDGRLVWTTGISSPGATGIRVEFTKATLPPGAKVFVTDGRENRTVTPTRTIHLQ